MTATAPSKSFAAIVAGRTPNTFAVSDSGAATNTIPLWSPPGVGDVQLQLALQYNSRNPNGVLGIGWSISGLSAITRCNKTWAQDGAPQRVLLTLADRFCLDGQQLKLVSGVYGQANSTYATEIESFARIVANSTSGNGPASFTVTTKNGLVYEYGSTTDSQIKPGGGATIRTWALSQIHDRVGASGNRISFTYTNDTANNTYRIASIAYPTTASGQGPFYEVAFTYVTNPASNIPLSYASGFSSREPNRLTTITIKNFGSSTPTKRYDLGYNVGTVTSRARLNSIQECSATNCLPATAIAYQNGSSGWSTTLNNSGVTTSSAPGVSPIPIDVNGDGLQDILYPKVQTGTTSRWWATLATATGFGAGINTGITTADADLEIAGSFTGNGRQQLLMYLSGQWKVVEYNGSIFTTTNTGVTKNGEYSAVDYDGDGLSDLVSVVGNDIRVRRNTTVPPGAVAFSATPATVYTYTGTWMIAGGAASRMSQQDFDGNGKADLYFTTYINTGFGNIFYGEVLYSNGFGSPATHLQIPPPIGSSPLAGDWNADGCSDIIAGQVYISDCAGGFVATGTLGSSNGGARMAGDWDGDGRTDHLYVETSNNTWYVNRSTGDGFAAAVSTGTAAPLGTQWFVFDKDGDGLLDAGFVDTTASNAIKFRVHSGATVPADLANSFTDGYGINQTATYKTISQSNYTKHTDATFPEQDFQGPLYVVSQYSASDGIGGTYLATLDYWGARLNLQGRGFEGFYAKRAIDNRNGLQDFSYFGRTFPYTGMLVGQTLKQSTGPEIRKFVSIQNTQPKGAAGYEQRFFPFLSPITATENEFGGPIDTQPITERVTTRTFGDAYGNPTIFTTTTTDKDTFSPFYNQSWTTTVTTAYDNNTTQNCLGLPQTMSVESQVPGQLTETRSYAYSNDMSLCRMWQEVVEPSTPALKVTTTLTFDPNCGNVQSVQVKGSNPDGSPMASRTTQFGFGTRCQLPEVVTNALLQQTGFAYFYDFGVLQSVLDPNSFLTEWQPPDDFGRPTRVDRPDGTATVWTYARCATPPCWGSADLRLQITEDMRDTSDMSFNSRQLYFDGMNRLRSYETNRVLGGLTKSVVIFDALGRVDKRYQPQTSSSNGYFQFIYDELNRTKFEKLYTGTGALDRTTGIVYAGRTVTVTDPLLRNWNQVRDVAGHLRRVIDPSPDGGTTAYDFDSFGNLNKITDANTPINAVSTGTYNLRGFLKQWADVDRGTWNFNPNSLNELVSWTNAKSQSFSAQYDPLGRLIQRTEPEGISNFVWGSVATENNIGALKSQSGYGYSEDYTYDGSGRLGSRTITSDQTYTYDYTYNSIGALNTIRFPTSPIPSGETVNRFRIQFNYSNGVPFRIKDNTDSTNTFTLWEMNTANDYSSPLTETLGTTTAVKVTSGYKLWTNELTSLMSGVSPSTNNRQNLAYVWDTAGNLTQRQDLSQSITEVFVPDPLNRVLSATRNADPAISVTYNPAGNILTKSDVGSYDYTNPQSGCTYYTHVQPHAVRKAGTVIYCYDANGNVVKRGGLTQSWASFDLPTVLKASISGTTYQSTFDYGPSHQRWRQVATYSDGTETTLYAGELLEKVTSTASGKTYWRHYVNTPTGLTIIVSRNSDNSKYVTYALSDHLGSSDAILDGISGALKTRESFDVWGARRGSDWKPSTAPDWTTIASATRRGFTFHEMLDNNRFTHMNGRVYEPALGRFLTVDPFVTDLRDSQSVNPYAYVGNRPLTYTDPSGFYNHDPHNGDRRNGFPAECGPACVTVTYSSSDVSFLDFLEAMVDMLGDIFGLGSEPPPPPPASAWPGTSAQNGTNICDSGATSAICASSLTAPTAGDVFAGPRRDEPEPSSNGYIVVTIGRDTGVWFVYIASEGWELFLPEEIQQTRDVSQITGAILPVRADLKTPGAQKIIAVADPDGRVVYGPPGNMVTESTDEFKRSLEKEAATPEYIKRMLDRMLDKVQNEADARAAEDARRAYGLEGHKDNAEK